MVRQNNVTKEQLGQFLGAGAATKLEDDDQKVLEKPWPRTTRSASRTPSSTRSARSKQYAKGGFTPWLYYQFGALALELDVWGIPKPKEEKEGRRGEEKKLTVDGLADMSSEEFLEFSEEEIAAFMKEAGVPAQFTAGHGDRARPGRTDHSPP